MPKRKGQPLPHEEAIRALDEAERRGLQHRDIDHLLARAIEESIPGPQEAMAFIIETFGPEETIRMIREIARREKYPS